MSVAEFGSSGPTAPGRDLILISRRDNRGSVRARRQRPDPAALPLPIRPVPRNRMAYQFDLLAMGIVEDAFPLQRQPRSEYGRNRSSEMPTLEITTSVSQVELPGD